MNNRKIAFLIIRLIFIAFIITSFVQAETMKQSRKPGTGAQVKERLPRGKGGPPGGPPVGRIGPPRFGPRPAEDRKQIYDRKKAFLRLDVNGDKNVSISEYDGPQKMFKEL